MYLDFDAEFSKLIVDTQFLAEKSIVLINKRKPESETLNELNVNAHTLLKLFSDSYNTIKKSFSVSKNINTAVMLFLKSAYKQKEAINSIYEYAKFNEFIISELNNVSKIKAKESMPQYF